MAKTPSTISSRRKAPRIPLKNVSTEYDRHGNLRVYLRLPRHKKIRIRAEPFDELGNLSTKFVVEYHEAKAKPRIELAEVQKPSPKNTMRWLFDQYYRSPDFQILAPATRRDKKSVLERYIEPIGDLNFKRLKRRHVLQSQLKRAHIPGAADKLVKYLKKLFNWAIEEGFAEFNPAAGIARINTGTGFSTWHTVQIEKFRRHYPRDHKARLAFEILLNTGARISDAVALTSLNLQNGRVEFVPHKTRNNPASRVSLPITEVLANLLKLHPLDGKALILNEHGNPFSVDGFGNRMRKWCDAAGIKDLSSQVCVRLQRQRLPKPVRANVN